MSAPSVKKKSFGGNSKQSVRMCIREQRDLITMSSTEACWPVPMRAIGAQNLLTMPGGVSSSGYLHKKGGSQFSLMKWPLRYIIIHKGCVYYFKSSTSPSPQGAFSLSGYNRVMRAAEETTSSNVFPFKIVHFSKKHRTWFFSAASEKERKKWMRYLRREIDHYNGRKESHIPSDSDSDTDSFYGTIERPMDIKHPLDNTEDGGWSTLSKQAQTAYFMSNYSTFLILWVDYIEEEDEEEEEPDYEKPDDDSSPTSTGRPMGPPPSYPPPPVPPVCLLRHDTNTALNKGLPPPIPPQHRVSSSSLPKPPLSVSPSSTLNSSKGPPPPLPFAPHLSKPSAPPLPPPSGHKKAFQGRAASMGAAGNDKRDCLLPTMSVQSPATLPICEQLERRLALDATVHCSLKAGGSQSLSSSHRVELSNHCTRPNIPTPSSTNRPANSNCLLPSQPTLPGHAPHSPVLRPGAHNKPGIPKPFPGNKPPVPRVKPKPPATPFQASPDGQSFRDIIVSESKRKPESVKTGEAEDSDEDYENVLLPDSVFINTTETSFVEKLFKDNGFPPEDGLYGIRNSGTKTSKVLVVWDVSIDKARNYRLFEENDCLFLDSEVTFPSLSVLIEHYHSHPLPHHGSLCLQKPYTKTMIM
ncbi:SH3 domain-binding protein 2 isoform X2 [Betta splendens]|uniref:SH3 domain-binding protein 2 n=1 Tax=Betta splendens TaxID=158456 RepID=A0A9W2Y624_BETSP|nr:SH3 domain-binding protein 2 isoform X2 [Betta splendens]